jgi:DNA polymerase bacteriophage-type
MLWLDLETYSETPISHGTDRYADNAEIMLAAYAFDDGDVELLDFTDRDQYEALQLIMDMACNRGHQVCIHNSFFDRTVLDKRGFYLPVEEITDTMVIALQHGLPGSLDKLCEIFKLDEDVAKIKDSKKLINLFCKPRPKKQKLRRATRLTHPAEWEQFKMYARHDITAMRAVYKKLPKFNDERELWQLDQKINDRGVCIDRELVEAAIATMNMEKKRLDEKAGKLTDGAVRSALQRDALLRYIFEELEVGLEDLRASTVEEMLKNGHNYPPELLELLANRLSVSNTSTAKYNTLQRATGLDGQLRGTLQFCGANRTGRWSGKLFQPQNLKRQTMKPERIRAATEATKGRCLDLFEPDVMEALSQIMRGAIVARPGRKLVVADLSNIEGRVLAWLAGERWKLKAFEQFDLGQGPDLYKVAAGRILAKPPEQVTGEERQAVGKVSELALGYQGGVGAFLTFAMAYGLDLEELAQKARKGLPKEALQAAENLYDFMLEKKMTKGLPRDLWIAIDGIKQAWRMAHEAIVAFWERFEVAAGRAIEDYRTVYKVGEHLTVVRKNHWLLVTLPSGRSLCYASPRVENGKITYWGVNQYTRKWSRIGTYGGKLAENACQAVARDVMAHGMLLAEPAGYEIALTVHDELVTDAPDIEEYSAKELAALMSRNPSWAKGLPLAAGGFESYRYRKG